MTFKGNTLSAKLLFPLLLLFHLLLLSVTQFTLWPEMVVYPYLANSGFLNYKEIINPYPPTLTLFLQYFTRIAGYTPLNYEILTWLLIIVVDILIFYFSLKFTKRISSALLSLLFFVILSVSFGINGLWFDLVQAPLILVSLFFLPDFLKDKDEGNLLISGSLISISLFVKQNSVVIVIWFCALIVYRLRNQTHELARALRVFLMPFFSLLCIYTIFYFLKGTLSDFYYWTFTFPFFKASSQPGYLQPPTIRQIVVVCSAILVFLPIIFLGKKYDRIILATALVTLLFAYPRFDFFHLIPFLSILSILFGQAVFNLKKNSLLTKCVFYTALMLLFLNSVYYFSRFTSQKTRFFEREIYDAASSLKQNLADEKFLYIQNGPDQLFPLSGKLPPKPWADEFPWYLQMPNVQDEVLKGIVKTNPQYVVYKPYDQGEAFALGSYKPQQIATYLDAHYKNYRQITATLWLKKRID